MYKVLIEDDTANVYIRICRHPFPLSRSLSGTRMPQWALLYVNFKHAFELPRGHYQNDGTRTTSSTRAWLSPCSISIPISICGCHVVSLVITIETMAAMIIIMFYIVIRGGRRKLTIGGGNKVATGNKLNSK